MPRKVDLGHKDDSSQWPVLAICYDFDKTLATKNMQEFGLIQDLGYEDSFDGMKRFWNEVDKLEKDKMVDKFMAGMYLFVQKMRRKRILVTPETFAKYGKRIEFYNGVLSWFDRIRRYGVRRHVKIEHYIISAGYAEMIAGCSIHKKVDKVFASSFYFDEDGEHVWPAHVIDYTGKTQMLFRIKKNKLNLSDESVNDHAERNRVPFRNIVYIGDSETDVPCMQIVRDNGGVSIGVYPPDAPNKDRILEIMKAGRISFYMPADYSAGAPIDELIKAVIDKTEKFEELERLEEKMQHEFEKAVADKAKMKDTDGATDAEKQPQDDSIKSLLDEKSAFYAPELDGFISYLDPIKARNSLCAAIDETSFDCPSLGMKLNGALEWAPGSCD